MLPRLLFDMRARAVSVLALLAVVITMLTVLPALSGTAWAAQIRHVATSGSDSAAGTADAPFRTLAKGLSALLPGDTLVVHGGTYAERITGTAVRPGTPDARTQVVAALGERPVVQGLLWLKNASYWDVRGINVTWGAGNTSGEHMVKMTGGTGWTFTDAEIWGAHSYAAVLVAGAAAQWTFARNHVHDTAQTNGTNQDHLVYVNSGVGGGVIERNLLVGSPNGRAIKVGPPSADAGVVEGITIRYNTMVDNLGPSNVQLAWGSSDVQVYRNIMVAPAPGRSAVTGYQLTGTGNVVRDNLGWATPRLLDEAVPGLSDGGGNFLADPGLDASYRPTGTRAADYGHLAGGAPAPEPALPPSTAKDPAPAPPASDPGPEPTPPPGQGDDGAAGLAVSATPMYTAGPAPAGQILARGAAAATNNTDRRLTLQAPGGIMPGDVLVASVDVRGRPTVTAPAGWLSLSSTDNNDTMRKTVFWRRVTVEEPATHTFALSETQAASGVLMAFAGVADISAVQAAAAANAPSRMLVTPSLTTRTAGNVMLALFGTAVRTSILAGPGLSEAAEASTSQGAYHVTSQVSVLSRPDAGASGVLTATAGHIAANIGAVVVLQPVR